MKLHFLLLLASVAALSSCNSSSDAAEIQTGNTDYDFWVTIEEAQEMAYNEGKHIVLDVYTEWCGFCRRMNQETYGDERVQEALNRYFYPVRIDAESGQEITFLDESYTMQDLSLQFGVRSFPTTIFLSPEGEPLAVQSGFIEAQQFYQMLSFVGSESYQSKSFQQYIESNQ